jgi:cytoskeletal protein RodZ
MALSQDEQRILAEIERRLAGDDPGLATSLTAFRRPPGKMMRSPRARIVGSLFTVLLVAMVSLTVYAMIPFRAQMGGKTPPSTSSSNFPAQTTISDASNSHSASASPGGTQPSALTSAPASTGASATSGASGSSSASATALADQQQAKTATTLLLPSPSNP